MERPTHAKKVEDENNEVQYEGEEGAYYGGEREGEGEGGDENYEEGDEGAANPRTSLPIAGRRALTSSEEEDRLADEEEEDQEEGEDESRQLTMIEYLAKQKASAKLAQLNSKLVQRRAGEGVNLQIGPKDAGYNLEEAAVSHFKEEVSFSPALTAAAMSWQTITENSEEEGRTFHASCVIHLPGKGPILMVHGGRDQAQRALSDAWWFHHDTQTWEKKHFAGCIPSARQAHTLTFMPGNYQCSGRIYMVGGNTLSGRDGVIHTLTIREKEDGEWQWGVHHQACSPRPNFKPDDRVPKDIGKLLAWCGCDVYAPYNYLATELLKPHWTDISGSYPQDWAPLSSHSAVAMPNEMWIFGGKLKTGASAMNWTVPLPRLVSLDSKSFNINVIRGNTSTSENVKLSCHNVQRIVVSRTQYRVTQWYPVPCARFGHMSVFVQTKGMYIIGGNSGTEELNDIWLLPYTGQWEKIDLIVGHLPTLVNGAAVSVDHLIYIFGGFSNGKALANLFVFDTSTIEQLDVPGTPPAPRGGHSMSLLEDALYIHGGSDEKGHIFSELFRLNNVADFSARVSLIGRDLAHLLSKNLMTDFEIVSSEGGAIKCHRTLLAARVPYFRELFAKTSSVANETFSEPIQVLERFVRFLYRDMVRLSAAQAPEMRKLAQKTSLPQLEAICESINNPTIIPPSRIAADMKWLLETGELSDVELVAGVRSFRAHRFILAARCPYFNAMFTSKFKEGQAGARVVVNDIEPELLQALLQFLYCESVDPQAHQMAFELLGQCELMELPDLMDRCSDILKVAISTENMALLYNAAEMFNAPVLASGVYKYAYDSGGLDEALIDEIPDALLDQVNSQRSRNHLPPLQRKEDRVKSINRPLVYSWNSACPKCALPFTYSTGAWTGKLPKELLVEVTGSAGAVAIKYDPVLSLTNQIGHRSKVIVAGVTVAPLLPRNTKRDAEQLAALAAWHVLKCGISLASIV